MTFLYKFNKNGTTAEGYVQADSEADAQAKVDAKFPEGSKTKVLGIEQVYVATTRNSRMSAFKGRPLAAACQGLKASDALKVVEFSPKKAAEIIKKTILSAIANAENNHGAKGAADLTVKLCVLEESVRMRRYWPTARGSAHPIARRLCHCKVVLTDEAPKAKKGTRKVCRQWVQASCSSRRRAVHCCRTTRHRNHARRTRRRHISSTTSVLRG